MLTREDLRWNFHLFSFASAVNVIPVSFHPLSGQMICERSMLRKFGFKFWQFLAFSQTIWILKGGLESLMSAQGSGRDKIPIMLLMAVGFGAMTTITFCIFDKGRELNCKLFNEIQRIRGKLNFTFWARNNTWTFRKLDEFPRNSMDFKRFCGYLENFMNFQKM